MTIVPNQVHYVLAYISESHTKPFHPKPVRLVDHQVDIHGELLLQRMDELPGDTVFLELDGSTSPTPKADDKTMHPGTSHNALVRRFTQMLAEMDERESLEVKETAVEVAQINQAPKAPALPIADPASLILL